MDFSILNTIDAVLHYQLFKINQTPITMVSLLIFSLVFLGCVLLSRFFSRVLMARFFSRLNIDRGTQYTFKRITEYTFIIIGAIISFQVINIDLSGLAVIFGLLSVGIGFGLQNITSNFIAGLILLFERPIQIGDRVTVGDIEGDVEEINIRSTTIRSLNNISIIVPNSEFISSQVTNWSHGDLKVRMDIGVGVSYASDLDNVLDALKKVGKENQQVLSFPEPEVLLTSFGDSSWNMELRVWLPNTERYYHIQSDLNCAIVRTFREKGVEIPFPQRDLHIRSPLPVPLSKPGPDATRN